jgi:hypothetical protein
MNVQILCNSYSKMESMRESCTVVIPSKRYAYLFCNKKSWIKSNTKLTNKSIICTKLFVLLRKSKIKLASYQQRRKRDRQRTQTDECRWGGEKVYLESLQKFGGATLRNSSKAVLEFILCHPNTTITVEFKTMRTDSDYHQNWCLNNQVDWEEEHTWWLSCQPPGQV